MDWMKQLGGVLDQYAQAGTTAPAGQAPATVEADFDRFAEAAPTNVLADGLAAAFRSDATPPFPSMASQVFGRAGGTQRAGMVNALLASVGPMVLQQILARRQQAGGGGAASTGGGLLEKILRGGGPAQVTPQEAEQMSPVEVEEIAREAEKKDPNIIDRISEIYAEQPQMLKVLGGAALAIALGRMAQKRNTL